MFSRALRCIPRVTIHRFRRDRRGATIVEFALVAAPFFALLFAILQTALIFFATQVLETGVHDAARLIRTGQAQEQELNAETFKAAVCSEIFGLFDCMGGLKIDVRTYLDFAGADTGKSIVDGDFQDDLVYQPGAGGDIVVVRAFYEWPMVLPTLDSSAANLNNGNYLLSAAATFRNEPF